MHKFDAFEGAGRRVVSAPMEPAGFWRRAMALCVDLLCFPFCWLLVNIIVLPLLAVTAIVPFVSGEALHWSYGFSLWSSVLAMIYFGFLEASPWQATPGKRLLGMKVVDEKGGRVSLIIALKRSWPLWLGGFFAMHWAMSFLFSMAFLICGFSVAFDKRGQGIHDAIAGCFVIRTNT